MYRYYRYISGIVRQLSAVTSEAECRYDWVDTKLIVRDDT